MPTRARSRPRATSAPGRGRSAQLPFHVSESKLHPPAARPGIVTRSLLVDRLCAEDTPPVVSVVAPPGYGKTTLLAQWAERKQARVGWVSADHRDNDPAVLLASIAVALDRVELIHPSVFRALTSPGAAVTVPPRLVSAIAAMRRPVTLVVDHLDAVTNRPCLDAIAELALGLPAGSQLAIGSRDTPPLPAARLRAQGGILEIGADDLTMDEHEAAALLEGAGVEPVDEHVRELVVRTEGWPVGLYLAALAMKAGSPYPDVGSTFTGEDRFVGDYLHSEFLDRLSPAEVSFLDAHLDPRPDVRSALRRHAGSDAIERGPGRAGRPKPAGDPARPTPGLVPLPPPVPRAAGGRAPRGASPSSSPSYTCGPQPGTRPTACRRSPSTTRRPAETPTAWVAWSCSWRTRRGPVGGPTPSCAGWSGSRPRAWSNAIRGSRSTAP